MDPLDRAQVALRRFADAVRARFGPRLKELKLFGSWARGDALVDSDVDVLVVVESVTREEKRIILGIASDIYLDAQHDPVDISPFIRTPEQFADLVDRERAVALEILREGVAL